MFLIGYGPQSYSALIVSLSTIAAMSTIMTSSLSDSLPSTVPNLASSGPSLRLGFTMPSKQKAFGAITMVLKLVPIQSTLQPLLLMNSLL